MYFELQLSANVFTRIVRNRLKALPLCIDRELIDSDGTPLVVDQVVVGETTWIQREQTIDLVNGLPKSKDIATQVVWIFSPTTLRFITVPFLQVKQEVSIRLVKSSDLDANGANPTAPFKILTIYPVFNVSLRATNQTQGGGPLSLSYTLAHIDFGALVLGLSDGQRADVQQFVSGVRLPPTTVDLGPLTAVLKRPIAAINAGIACDPAGSFVALRTDFDVYASPVALGEQFFEAGPTNLLAGKDWAMFLDANLLTQDAKAMAKDALQSSADVKLDSGPDVSWDPGGPAIDISASVELVDACPFFVDNIDMDADVSIRTSFSVSTPNTLRMHFHITTEPSNLSEEVACALTGALLWPFIGPLFLKDEEAGKGLGVYIGGLAGGPAAIFIGIIAAIESASMSKDISKSLGSTCKKQDDENYECNDVQHLVMRLSPPFQSRLELDQAYGIPEGFVLVGLVRDLPDRVSGSVGVTTSRLEWTVSGTCSGGFAIASQAQIKVTGTADSPLCKAYVLSDPANEFALATEDGMVTIRPRFQPSFVSAPYPCRVRVVTTAGVRTITLPPPAAITDAERQHLESLRHNFERVCQLWKDTFTKIENVRWKVPGPVEVQAVQFWQIVLKGMRPDDTIRVEGLKGETIMTARPSRAGVIHLSMMFPGDRAPSELSLVLVGQRHESDQARRMSGQQVQFEHRASLPVHGSLRTMRFEGNDHNRRLIVVNDDQEMSWDVSVPIAPVLLSSITRMNRVDRDAIIVHTGKRVGTVPTSNLLRALESLRGDERLLRAVGSPKVGGIGETLYMRTKHGATLFDISCPEEPCEVHVYNTPAWYEGVALGGRLMAQHNHSLNVIELYAATSTKML